MRRPAKRISFILNTKQDFRTGKKTSRFVPLKHLAKRFSLWTRSTDFNPSNMREDITMRRMTIILLLTVGILLPGIAGAASEKDFEVQTTENIINLCTTVPDDPLYHQAVNFCSIFFHPVMPIPLTESWKLITLPVVSVELYQGRPVDNKKGVIL